MPALSASLFSQVASDLHSTIRSASSSPPSSASRFSRRPLIVAAILQRSAAGHRPASTAGARLCVHAGELRPVPAGHVSSSLSRGPAHLMTAAAASSSRPLICRHRRRPRCRLRCRLRRHQAVPLTCGVGAPSGDGVSHLRTNLCDEHRPAHQSAHSPGDSRRRNAGVLRAPPETGLLDATVQAEIAYNT